jgi:cell division protease FtsH
LKKTAYHEAGHALVGVLLPKCQPVYKATIIARGGAGGMVMSLPEMDRLNFYRDECHDEIAMTMAGKAAEIFKYGEDQVSNGPSGDIQQASSLARAMIMRWGMSDKVGNIDYSEAAEGYSGRTSGLSTSAGTKELIEREVRTFVQDGYDLATKVITENQERFENLAQGLLEYETLTGAEIKKVMEGEVLNRDEDADDRPSTGGTPSVTAIPKTKPKVNDGGLEPNPTT